MKRTVTKVGQSSLMITLPAKWAREQNVTAGSPIDVTVNQDGSLHIAATPHTTPHKISYTLSPYHEKYIGIIIRSFYRAGYDEVSLSYENPALITAIKKVLPELLGFEMLEHGKNYCIIKNIAETLDGQFESMLKRMFFHIFELGVNVYGDLKNNLREHEHDIFEHIASIYKLSEVLKRILNRYGYRGKPADMSMMGIVWDLRKLSNEYKYMYGVKRAAKMSAALVSYFEETNALLRLYYDAVFKKEQKQIDTILLKKEHLLYRDFYALLKKLKPDEIALLHHLAGIIRRVYEMAERQQDMAVEFHST